MRTSAFGFMLVLACLVLWPVDVRRAERDRRRRQGCIGLRAARRHRRSSPVPRSSRRPARPSPMATASTASSACVPASTRSRSRCPASPPSCAQGIELTSDFTATRQRRDESRRDRRDDHRHRRVADRGHAEHHRAHGHDARGAGCAADRPQHPGGRHHDSRHGARARRRRRAVARRRRLGQRCSSRRSSTAAPATRCRRSKACASTTSCAQGAYSGVYWNDASFQEISYITGADSAEMGQGGMRVNMVPRDGGNTFRGQVIRQLRRQQLGVRQLRLARRRSAVRALEPDRRARRSTRTTGSPTSPRSRRSGTSTRRSAGPIKRDKLWFNYTFRHWGVDKTVADSYFDRNPRRSSTSPTRSRPASTTGTS